MKDLVVAFNYRVEEVEKYFAFLTEIDKIEAYKQDFIEFSDGRRYTVESDLQKIMKSNCFLILYNLVESSIRDGIVAIYDAIHDEKLQYADVNEKIRKIWLNHRCDNLTDPLVSKQTVLKAMQSMIEDTTEGKCIALDRTKIKISGNLDMKAIQALTEDYGFYGKINNNDERLKYVISTIKTMRNNIAHGTMSFRAASKNITLRELVEFKDRTVSYLLDIIKNINDFIANKKYT